MEILMQSIIPTSVSEWFTAAVLSLIGLAIGMQTILKNWKSNSTESSLLNMMHDELERMSAQNSVLSQEIGKLQTELIKLSTQLTTLTVENQNLQSEVANLNKEIVRLHGFISQKST